VISWLKIHHFGLAVRVSTLVFSFSLAAVAYDGKPMSVSATEKPKELEGVGIEEKLGTYIDPELTFKDENGQDVKLAQFFDGKTPTIISPVYYSCPGLCNFHLNGLTDGLKELDWNVGQKFKVVAISFDPSEKPDVASGKKESYMQVYSRPGTEKGWHFLTGDQETINKFTQAIGFKYKWNEKAKEWSHSSAAIVTSPKGEITRYLPGIVFEAKNIKLALNEAAEGKIGSFAESLILYCFQYDRHQNTYSLAAFRLVQMAGGLFVLLLAIWLLPVWFRAKKTQKS